jgi:hypothetical protein
VVEGAESIVAKESMTTLSYLNLPDMSGIKIGDVRQAIESKKEVSSKSSFLSEHFCREEL